MKIAKNMVATGNVTNASAGNQKREFDGVSGTKYDMSFMAKAAEAAETVYGEKRCSLSVGNQVNITSNNVDQRSATEKLLGSGQKTNGGFSVYFEKTMGAEIVEADKALQKYFSYQLDSIKKMEEQKYRESMPEMLKSAAIKAAKGKLKDNSIELSVEEWEMVLSQSGVKPKQVGINTLELSIRASSVDPELDKPNSDAWKENETTGTRTGLYNAAGTKTLPLFTDAQVDKAKEISEEIVKKFTPAFDILRADPNNLTEYFKKFCEIAKELGDSVPETYKQRFFVWSPDQQDKIDALANKIVAEVMAIGGV